MSSYDNQKTDSTCYGIAGGTHAIGLAAPPTTKTRAHTTNISIMISMAPDCTIGNIAGRYYRRDVDRDTNGSDVRVQKDYVNPNTGTSFHRETEYDVKDKGGSVCAPSVSGSS